MTRTLPRCENPARACGCHRARRRRRIPRQAWPWIVVIAGLVALLVGRAALGQTTRPVPVGVWFQPEKNLAKWRAMNVNTFLGPELPNRQALTPAQVAAGEASWIRRTIELGAKVVLKNPTGDLPANCAGILVDRDEPNGKGWPAAVLKGEVDRLRARYPGVPIFLSLAGDKVTSANFARPAELQAYLDYAALPVDAFLVNAYSCNRNATRYPLTWTAQAVGKLAAATGKPVYAVHEMDDQQLQPPPKPADGVDRAPTPAEIKAQVDASLAAGAAGVVWFATSPQGKYGWDDAKTPEQGDSWMPLVDRNKASMRPQYDMVTAVGKALALKPTTLPATQPAPVTGLPPDLDARITYLETSVRELRLQLERGFELRGQLVPATRPAN